MDSPRQSPRAATTASCLVIVPTSGSAGPPWDLIESLKRRGVEVTIAGDPFHAMLHASRWWKDGPLGRFVVFVDPARQAGSGAVYRAMNRYAPGLPRWMFDAVGGLRAATADDAAAWPGGVGAATARAAPAPVVEPVVKLSKAAAAARKSERPRLRLAGEGPALRPLEDGLAIEPAPAAPLAEEIEGRKKAPGAADAAAEARQVAGEPGASSILTSEELELLLGDGPLPGEGGGGRPNDRRAANGGT